jgi:S-adenosylmethionine decarboxylase
MKQRAMGGRWTEPAAETVRDEPSLQAIDGGKDHFVVRDGVRFAGTHLILDLWGARRLDDEALIEKALRRIVRSA